MTENNSPPRVGVLLYFYWTHLQFIYREAAKYLRWCRLGPKGFIFGLWFAGVLSLWRLCHYTGVFIGLCLGWLFMKVTNG